MEKNQITTDEKYMRRCIQLAEIGLLAKAIMCAVVKDMQK